jgi:hypothetical protein
MFEPTVVTATNPAVEVFTGKGTQGGPGAEERSSFLVLNNGAATVYLGADATVNAANGYPLAPGQSIPFGDLGQDDALFAFAAAPTELRVLGLL